MIVPSPIFVNREKELKQIKEAVETLQDEQRLLRTPILEFSGLQGIGKTTLLQQIKGLCDSKGLSCIVKNAEQITAHDFNQVESLIKVQPTAMILDSLDAVNNEQLQSIETRLGDLIESTRLFVILASRDIKKFERTRSIARKLTVIPLEPLKRESCFLYFDQVAQTIPPNIRDIIFDWTGGYPIAMEVMTRTILNEQLDPTKDEDGRQLVSILMKEVIEEKLLANAPSLEEQARLQTLLALLSVPRRFNLTLTQDLIKEFSPRYELANSLAYITLPKAINEVTSVLSWNLERSGFCIDASVRHLFLLQYGVEHPQELNKIHTFLAKQNEQFAQEVSGSDHIRYLREFLYHLACSGTGVKVRESLAQQIERLAQVQALEERNLLQSYEGLVQFYEEFQQDQELKEALGTQNTSFALSLIYKHFLAIYRLFPENERGSWLINFFSLVAQQPQNRDFDLIFEEGMRQIIKQVSSDDAIKLYEELSLGEELRGLLGKKFDKVSKRVLGKLLNEEVVQDVDAEHEVHRTPERD
jgi:hypothetical protein